MSYDRATRSVLSAVALSAMVGGCASPEPADEPVGPTVLVERDATPGLSTVHVAGVDPSKMYELVQCRSSAAVPDLETDCDTTRTSSRSVRPDSAGDGSATFQLHAVIGIGGRSEVDCIADPCLIALTDGAAVVTTSPIEWARAAAAPPAPVLTITRLTFPPRGNRGTALVVGEGFPAGARATVVQCPAAPPADSPNVDGGDCLYAYGTRVRADDSGGWTKKVVVYRRFQRSDNELIDCDRSPEICALAIPWPSSADFRMTRVTFDSAPTGAGE